jgi:hypothetical protein
MVIRIRAKYQTRGKAEAMWLGLKKATSLYIFKFGSLTRFLDDLDLLSSLTLSSLKLSLLTAG